MEGFFEFNHKMDLQLLIENNLKLEAIIMKRKKVVVLSVIFLLFLTSCSLFEDPPSVTVIEPQKGDILIKGQSFKVVADIDTDYKINELNVRLFWASVQEDDSTDYDSTLWEYDFTDEAADFLGKITIEKELTVPLDAPVGDDYRLVLFAMTLEGTYTYGYGEGYSTPVCVHSSK